MIEINKNPSARELSWFGAGLLAFSALVAGLVYWRGGSHDVALSIVGVGAGVTLLYYAVRPLRRWVYLVWMYAAYPIGWAVSHAVMAAVYFLVVTPIGLVMRARGYDPLNRRFDRSASTYWIPHNPGADVKRYFRQF